MEYESSLFRAGLKAMGFVALAGLWALTGYAVYGPHPLPARIATHFDASGQANGWGEPRMLWLLPIVATGVYGAMWLVARHPAAFNYPIRVTAATRPKLESMTLGMISWLQFELVCLFVWIQWAIVRSAQAGRSALSPALLPTVLLIIFGTIAWHFVAMLRIGRDARQ
jgi:uncharacterized membrane protein